MFPLRNLLSLALLAALLPPTLPAQEPAWKWQNALTPDVGFDLDQAKVIHVTSLAPRGAGTLADAISEKGPRLVVFDVAGVIELDRKSLSIREPDLYIAGQTAPAPGITIIKGGLVISADRVVVQHLHIRPGDAGRAKKSGWEPDGLSTDRTPSDVWIDHISATWSVDENISASMSPQPGSDAVARRIFIRNCLIAEGLSNSTHAKGPHSKGTLVFDGSKEIAIVGNLYVSNVERNPVFKPDTSGVVVNNVIANPGQRALHASPPDAQPGNLPSARIAAVGNIVLGGREMKKTAGFFEGVAEIFLKDNEAYTWKGTAMPIQRVPFQALEAPPVWPDGLTASTPAAAIWNVARLAGARPAERDPIDSRIIREALTGTARIINSQDEVEGYPRISPVTRPVEVPDKERRKWLEEITALVTYGPPDPATEPSLAKPKTPQQ